MSWALSDVTEEDLQENYDEAVGDLEEEIKSETECLQERIKEQEATIAKLKKERAEMPTDKREWLAELVKAQKENFFAAVKESCSGSYDDININLVNTYAFHRFRSLKFDRFTELVRECLESGRCEGWKIAAVQEPVEYCPCHANAPNSPMCKCVLTEGSLRLTREPRKKRKVVVEEFEEQECCECGNVTRVPVSQDT